MGDRILGTVEGVEGVLGTVEGVDLCVLEYVFVGFLSESGDFHVVLQ